MFNFKKYNRFFCSIIFETNVFFIYAFKSIINKKVLLRESKGHTARRVARTCTAVPEGDVD